MSLSEPRPQTASSARWADGLAWLAIIVCATLFAGLTYYRVRSGDLNEVDAEREAELFGTLVARPIVKERLRNLLT